MKPYIRKPQLVATIGGTITDKAIVGIAIVDGYLYVVRSECRDVEVYQIQLPDRPLIGVLRISGIRMVFNMASSARKRCLYLADFAESVGNVRSVSLSKNVDELFSRPSETISADEKEVHVKILEATVFAADVGRPLGISVSSIDDRVLVVCENPNRVRIYSPYKTLLSIISLSETELEAPRQAIQFSPGRLALIHGFLGRWNRLCLIDTSGNVLGTYGTTSGSAPTQIHWPAALIVDGRGRMLIGDRENNRVHLVGRDFKLVRHLLTGSDGIVRPRRLAFHPADGTLYVGQVSPEVKVFRVAHPMPPEAELGPVPPPGDAEG